jgi:PAS domain S-box-containing protein
LQASLRSRPNWNAELTRIDEQVRTMRKAYGALPLENFAQQRVKLAGDFQLARDRGVQQAESLRNDVAQSERDVIVRRRARWHGIGASAIAEFVFILGCMAVWLVFDRALQKAHKARLRLAETESRFRLLIENDAEPLVLLGVSGKIEYANPAWLKCFGREPEDLIGTSLMELIHADDRPRVLPAWQGAAELSVIACRLSADYGVWHDVEMHVSRHNETTVVRIRDLRETSEFAQVKRAG